MRVKVAHLVLVAGVVNEIEEAGPIPGTPPARCACRAGFFDHPGPHDIPVFRIAMATIVGKRWDVGWFTNRGEYDVFARDLPRGRAERRLRRAVARGGEVRPLL